jgi:protocatechuate 3,4-dioxygenase alpha subunit
MGEPVPDALVELWQADAQGEFPSGGAFRGFARAPTDRQGCYRIVTVKPGALRGPDGSALAPHASIALFARGLLKRLVTRVYFADEPDANERDPLLSRLPDAARATLLARPLAQGYRFDIRLQGEGETAFFDG